MKKLLREIRVYKRGEEIKENVTRVYTDPPSIPRTYDTIRDLEKPLPNIRFSDIPHKDVVEIWVAYLNFNKDNYRRSEGYPFEKAVWRFVHDVSDGIELWGIEERRSDLRILIEKDIIPALNGEKHTAYDLGALSEMRDFTIWMYDYLIKIRKHASSF